MKNFFVFKVLEKFGIPAGALNYIKSLLALAKEMPHGFPKELFDLNIMNLLRGIFTRIALSTNLDWILPYWIEKQYDSSSKSFIGRGFQLSSVNVAHRNWTQIGALDSVNEAVVDQRGLLVPYRNAWSLDFWLSCDGELLAPSQLEYVDQKLDNTIPVVVTEFSKENIQVTSKAFVENIDGTEIAFEKVSIKNRGAQPHAATLYFSVRPYNVDGMSLIKKIKYSTAEDVFIVNSDLGVKFLKRPDKVFCSDFDKGDVSLFLNSEHVVATEAKCAVGLCTAAVEYNIELRPGETQEFDVILPVPKTPKSSTVLENVPEFSTVFETYEVKWNNKLAEGMNIDLPDKDIQAAFDINKAYMLLFYDVDSINPGPLNYHSFWFRDAAYLVNALDKLGYEDEAKNVLSTYPKRQKRDGFFMSQLSEWDSNGESIWVLMEHYKLNKNREYLEKMYPSIKKGANWLLKKLKETDKESVPSAQRGLLPPGLSAEHFGANDSYYWDDFWALAGLREAAVAAGEMNDVTSKNLFESGFDKLLERVNISLKEVEKRLGAPLMPISPNRRMDSAAVGCLSALYPTRVFSPDDERIVTTIKYMEENLFNGNGFFHDVNHSGFGTYLTAHFVECHTFARSQRAIEILDWLVDVSTATYTWPESINPLTLGGCIGDGHHGWAAADFIVAIRNMLFFEDGKNLVILPSAPKRWFRQGKTFRVKHAPSYFGKVSFEVFYEKDTIIINFDNGYTELPEFIEINLPFSIKSASADGKDINVQAGKLFIQSQTRKVEINVA